MFDKSSKKMFSTCDSKMKNEMEIQQDDFNVVAEEEPDKS